MKISIMDDNGNENLLISCKNMKIDTKLIKLSTSGSNEFFNVDIIVRKVRKGMSLYSSTIKKYPSQDPQEKQVVSNILDSLYSEFKDNQFLSKKAKEKLKHIESINSMSTKSFGRFLASISGISFGGKTLMCVKYLTSKSANRWFIDKN